MLNKLDRNMKGVLAGEGKGWRRARGEAPLTDVNRTILVRGSTAGRRLVAFFGPGYLVAVGYMDPGNWATSLAGGSKFGYTLLSVTFTASGSSVQICRRCAHAWRLLRVVIWPRLAATPIRLGPPILCGSPLKSPSSPPTSPR